MPNRIDQLSRTESVDIYVACAAVCQQAMCRADPNTNRLLVSSKEVLRQREDKPNGKVSRWIQAKLTIGRILQKMDKPVLPVSFAVWPVHSAQ